eukprot:TRINITY_DN61002_c0_g1_i1.p1 TRINITY_DN61002_c0_g1~~TRINITY_DN61002_c0_g1_i1.p1  ORF type:complete len:795 (+),score=159.29 TRINITY_DN61002_c0_g1_i1:82-2466(+)
MTATLPEDPGETNQRAVVFIMTVVAAGFFVVPPVSCASAILVTAFRSTCISFAMGVVVAHTVTARGPKQIFLHWALFSNETAWLIISRMWCFSFVSWLGLGIFEHFFVVAFCFFLNLKFKGASLATVHILYTFLGGVVMYIIDITENGGFQVKPHIQETMAAWPAIAVTTVGLLVGGMVYLHSSANHALFLTLQAAKEKVRKVMGLDGLDIDYDGVHTFGVVPGAVSVPTMQTMKIQPPRQCPSDSAIDNEPTITKQDAALQHQQDVILPGVATDKDTTLEVSGQDSEGAEYIQENCISGEIVAPQADQVHSLQKALAELRERRSNLRGPFEQEDDAVPKEETDTMYPLQNGSRVRNEAGAGDPCRANSVHDDDATLPGAVTEQDALEATLQNGNAVEEHESRELALDAARQDSTSCVEARGEHAALSGGLPTEKDVLDASGKDGKAAAFVEPRAEDLLPRALAELRGESAAHRNGNSSDPARNEDALDATGKNGQDAEYMHEARPAETAVEPHPELLLEKALAALRGSIQSGSVNPAVDSTPMLINKTSHRSSGKKDMGLKKKQDKQKKQNAEGPQLTSFVSPSLGEALRVLRVGSNKAGSRSSRKRLRAPTKLKLKRISENPSPPYQFAGTIKRELQMHLEGMTAIIYGGERASALRRGMENSGINVASVHGWSKRLLPMQVPEDTEQEELAIMDVNDDMEESQLLAYLEVLDSSEVGMYCLLTEDYQYAVDTQQYLQAAGWEVLVATISPRQDYYIGLMRKAPALARTDAVRDLDDMLAAIDWDAADPGTP